MATIKNGVAHGLPYTPCALVIYRKNNQWVLTIIVLNNQKSSDILRQNFSKNMLYPKTILTKYAITTHILYLELCYQSNHSYFNSQKINSKILHSKMHITQSPRNWYYTVLIGIYILNSNSEYNLLTQKCLRPYDIH